VTRDGCGSTLASPEIRAKAADGIGMAVAMNEMLAQTSTVTFEPSETLSGRSRCAVSRCATRSYGVDW
jgi:hypothetical protein